MKVQIFTLSFVYVLVISTQPWALGIYNWEGCMNGVICVYVSVHMHVCGLRSKTHFEL